LVFTTTFPPRELQAPSKGRCLAGDVGELEHEVSVAGNSVVGILINKIIIGII
jgi:hypothetical protein